MKKKIVEVESTENRVNYKMDDIGIIKDYIESFFDYNEKYKRNIRFELRKWSIFESEKIRLYELNECGSERGYNEISLQNTGILADFFNNPGNVTLKLRLLQEEIYESKN